MTRPIKRREFLLGAGASFFLAPSMLVSCSKAKAEPWIVSACSNQQGQHFIAAFSLQGQLVNALAVPDRCHDVLALPHKPGSAIVFCRRPDTFALEVDLANKVVTNSFHCQPDTHFYGHGVLSADSQYLFTTENQYDKKRGLVVVRDAKNYQVLERFDSGGIGPHELILMPDNSTLAIANGGILTHPKQARKKLNLQDMQPNLTYMKSTTGDILGQYTPPDPQLSLRHLTSDSQGKVYVGAQYQGDKNKIQALVFSHYGQQKLRPLNAQPRHWSSMQQYTASLHAHGKHLYVTSPRGAIYNIWDTQTGDLINTYKMRDVSGIAQAGQNILLSNGKGYVRQVNSTQINLLPYDFKHVLKFDNHMTTIQSA